jgi:hypothetical protein
MGGGCVADWCLSCHSERRHFPIHHQSHFTQIVKLPAGTSTRSLRADCHRRTALRAHESLKKEIPLIRMCRRRARGTGSRKESKRKEALLGQPITRVVSSSFFLILGIHRQRIPKNATQRSQYGQLPMICFLNAILFSSTRCGPSPKGGIGLAPSGRMDDGGMPCGRKHKRSER